MKRLLFSIFAMILLVPALVNAATLILQTADTENLQDTFGDSSAPDVNKGSSDRLDLYSGNAAKIYITFNLNATELIGATITSVNLSLYVHLAGGTAKDIAIHEFNSSVGFWDEATFTYNTQPCGTGFNNALLCNLTAESTVLMRSVDEWFNISVTGMVRKHHSLGTGNVSMILKFVDETGSSYNYFRSKEHATTSTRPILTIGYEVAEPDSTPPIIGIISPLNNTALSQTFINFTVTVTDDISDNIICHLRNETDLLDEDVVSSGTTFNLTYDSEKSTIQQTNLYNITCFDNDETNNNSLTAWMNITLDNIFPIITINLPLNNSVIDKTFSNLTIDISCSDPNIIALNSSLIDGSGAVVSSIQNNTAGTEMIIKNVTDLTNIPTGKYNINLTCVDGHTYYDSKVKAYIKDEALRKVYYITDSGNDISIQMFYSTVPLCDFGSRSASDREIFWYDFKSCNPKSTEINTYKFMVRDNDAAIKYLPKSNYKSHFVTKENFITLQLDEPASYKVRKLGKNYEVTIYTTETFLDFSNSIGGNNFVNTFLNITIIQTNFTALEHFSFTLPDIIFDSSTPLEVANITFNLSEDRLLIFRNSMTVEKFTNPQESIVSAILTFNGNVIFNSSIRTVSTVGNIGSASLIPLKAAGLSGENSLLIELTDSGVGAINVSTWDISITTNMTSRGKEIRILRENKTITFSSTEFTNITSFTFDKLFNSSTYLNVHHLLSADGSTTVQCSINRTVNSPFYERFISSSTDIGSSGISYIDLFKSIGQTAYNLTCKNDNANTVTNVITVLAYDLTDSGENIIQSNQSTNPATDIANTVSLTAGLHELASIKNIEVKSGDSLEIISTVILGTSSGIQTPRVFINSSKDSCSNSHLITLSGNTDILTVKFYSSCNATPFELIDITLGVEVEAGETLIVKDESLSIFETKTLNLTFENVAPTVVIIEPLNNSILFNVNKIEWVTTDGNKDSFTTNITVRNSTDTVQVATDLGDDIFNVLFNFSVLGNGLFIINITSTENETTKRLSGTNEVIITIQFPFILVNLTTPLNNSVDIDGLIVFKFITDTGGSNNCSLYINSAINQSINATIGENTFQLVRLSNATHTWLVRCDNSSLLGVSEQFIINVLIPDPNALSFIVCPNTSAGMFKLVMIVLMSIVFITLGLAFKVGFIGVFGSVMLMISSWFISPCSNIFAYSVALLSILLMLFFIARGFLMGRKEGE